MMIGLYYIEHRPLRYFLSPPRESLDSYRQLIFINTPNNHPTFQCLKAIISYHRFLFISLSYRYFEILQFLLLSITPYPKRINYFYLRKELQRPSPHLEVPVRHLHFISFLRILPFHPNVHCMMPEGIENPYCGLQQTNCSNKI